MKELLQEVQKIEQKEYARAKETFGATHHSKHEAYAVILEEFEEAEQDRENFEYVLIAFWDFVKENKTEEACTCLKRMQICAEHAAAEWIQVAAMCYKAIQEE